MTVGVVIQARMGSTRLPGKVLRLIGERPLLGHVIDRSALIAHPVKVVVATSVEMRDQSIADWCAANAVDCFRGSEQDVLDRYWQCAYQYGFDHIVRLTADNPFTDVEELDRLLEFHLRGDYDYSHSFGQMPLGVGGEIFSRAALERSHIEGHAWNHREHVNEFIEEHPQSFNIGRLQVPASKCAPSLRMTVDTLEDWQRASWLVEVTGGRKVGTEEAIRLCSSFA